MAFLNNLPLYTFTSFAKAHYNLDGTKEWKFPENTVILFEHCTKSPKGYGSTTSISTRAVFNQLQEEAKNTLFKDKTIIRVNVNLKPDIKEQQTEAFQALNDGGGVPVLVDNGEIVTEEKAIYQHLLTRFKKECGKESNLEQLASEHQNLENSLTSRTIEDHAISNPSQRGGVLKAIKDTVQPDQDENIQKAAELNGVIKPAKERWLANINSQLERWVKKGGNLEALANTHAGWRVTANMKNVERFNDTGPGGFRTGVDHEVESINVDSYPYVKALCDHVKALPVYRESEHGPQQKKEPTEYKGIQSTRVVYTSVLQAMQETVLAA